MTQTDHDADRAERQYRAEASKRETQTEQSEKAARHADRPARMTQTEQSDYKATAPGSTKTSTGALQ